MNYQYTDEAGKIRTPSKRFMEIWKRRAKKLGKFYTTITPRKKKTKQKGESNE